MDVDVRFGAFTCIAGANGVGKSNLFDAIRFLSALADLPLNEAALSVRNESGRASDPCGIFHRVGSQYDETMSFEAEMIVPTEGVDDLGQKAQASINFLRYAITIAYRSEDSLQSPGRLELVKEELKHIRRGKAGQYLLFPHSAQSWRSSALWGERRVPFFISTEGEGRNRVIKLHQDGGRNGRPLPRSAVNLPRTVLSVSNAAESPTALLARLEMRSWRLLQLEPSALRKPDEFTAPNKLRMDGLHLPATLYHLARLHQRLNGGNPQVSESQFYGQLANRLSELMDDVRNIDIDHDEKRELLTVRVTGADGIILPARDLSDGTLRFLALAVLELNPEEQGLLCFEEPENGIHPERIPAMLRLLEDIATDVNQPIGPDNPLRQVIINTHSPAIVGEVPDDSLLVAELKEMVRGGRRFKRVCFSCLTDTWRAKIVTEKPNVVSKGKLLSYLNPISRHQEQRHLRVVDRPDLQILLPFLSQSK
ncbi:MAG: AAA family ATPase [Blastocatellia bacterium]